jgi:GH25 family lysozyme M1 (1,4-beta-N-acetylmuramidase)
MKLVEALCSLPAFFIFNTARSWVLVPNGYGGRKFATFGVGILVLGVSFLASAPARAQRPLGIDVYAGSGTITWSSVKNASFTFAWTKATEGTYYKDANFTNNEVNGKAAGVYMGAYDFCRPDLYSPVTEANYFWNYAGNYIKNDGKTLMPMLDVETFNGYTNASSYSDWVNQWCHSIQTNAAAHGVTVTPVIYISACNASYLNTSVSQWIPWIADYNGENAQTGTPWSTCTSYERWGSGVWKVWQFTSSAIISGVPGNSSGHCDEDVFNGSSADVFSTLVVGPIAVTNPPADVTVALGGTAAFNVGASGSGTLRYQWSLNQTNIPGATNETYVISDVQPTNVGGYSVTISNNVGGIVSGPAYLTILSNAPGSVLAPANMVNWWPAENTPVDIFGTNDATPYNGLYYTNGEIGAAFHFNGSSYLLVNNATELAPSWTVCLWVNRQNAAGTSASLMGDGTYAIKLEQYNGTREVGITQSGVADYIFSPAYTVPVNTWTHLAFVGTSTTVTLYVNGVLKGTVSASNFQLPCACIGGDLIGNGSLTDPMQGSLDEIQVYHRALSGSEIAAIYNVGSAGLVRLPEFIGVNTGNGQIQLELMGQTGKTFTLYDSTDLLNWTLLGAVSNPTGAIQYQDSTGGPQKFYRVSQP